MFDVVTNIEQTKQITAALRLGSILMCSTYLFAILQKLLERKVWALAQEKNNKAENLNNTLTPICLEISKKFL